VAATKVGGGRGVFRFLVFLLFIAAVGGAFYAGMIYQRQRQVTRSITNTQPSPSPQSSLADKRAAIDADPSGWLIANNIDKLGLDSRDPEFLYLYGRAKMLLGDHRAAMEAFELAIGKVRSESRSDLPLATELKIADAAAALKLNQESPGQTQQASMAEQKALGALDDVLGTKPPGK
jgi:hypothetical protein